MNVGEWLVSAVFLVIAIVIIWALPLVLAVLTIASLPLSKADRRVRRWTALWATVVLAGITAGLYPWFPAGIGLGMLVWTGYWLVRLVKVNVKNLLVKRRNRRTLARLDKELTGGV